MLKKAKIYKLAREEYFGKNAEPTVPGALGIEIIALEVELSSPAADNEL